MEEPRIQSRVIAVRRQTQQINIRLGNREVIIIARLVDQGKDAIGDPNRIQDQEESPGLEQDPFHVGLGGETLAPAGEIEEPRYIIGSKAADDEFGV